MTWKTTFRSKSDEYKARPSVALFFIPLLSILYITIIYIILLSILYFSDHTNTLLDNFLSKNIALFFLGGIQLFSIGILGEYIFAIFNQVRRKPLVVERERINFEQ
mgnify:CR=1 FL=1